MKFSKEVIKRFISDKYSMNDYSLVKKYFAEDRFDSELEYNLEDEWNKTNELENSSKLGHLLDKLHHKINLNKSKKIGRFTGIYRSFSKVAAALFIPALITIAVFTINSFKKEYVAESWTKIYSPVGARTNFQLPDGSTGWLNSESSIKYLTDFGKKRLVEVSGEVWFDVVKKGNQDFKVETPYFDVKVLGTQFNVIAFDDEEYAEVILEEGAVEITGKDNVVKSRLAPNERFIQNISTKDYTKSTFDAKSYCAWKDGLLIFKNVPISEIATRIGRKYNADIILHGDALNSEIFRATFQDESLEEICRLLAAVAPIEYKIHKRIRQNNNLFSKNKVEIWIKN